MSDKMSSSVELVLPTDHPSRKWPSGNYRKVRSAGNTHSCSAAASNNVRQHPAGNKPCHVKKGQHVGMRFVVHSNWPSFISKVASRQLSEIMRASQSARTLECARRHHDRSEDGDRDATSFKVAESTQRSVYSVACIASGHCVPISHGDQVAQYTDGHNWNPSVDAFILLSRCR